MYVAELKGKLSSKLHRSEDILTSDVFSFFKYADRKIYLSSLIKILGLSATNKELLDAEFVFWPKYDDGTEPDLVLEIGQYYLLFEAKYLSGFGKETAISKGQLEREIEGGLYESRNRGMRFMAIAITAHYNHPKDIFVDVYKRYGSQFMWINWQSISKLLLDLLENHEDPKSLQNSEFAYDLYRLLEERNLRGFLSFDRFVNRYKLTPKDKIFFAAQSSNYRGKFIGFKQALSDLPIIDKQPSKLFYNRNYFMKMPKINSIKYTQVFYGEIL